jgi:hypothetical protein
LLPFVSFPVPQALNSPTSKTIMIILNGIKNSPFNRITLIVD